MNKWIIYLFAFLICGMNAMAQWDDYINFDNGSFIDDRDGQEYDWIKIGDQIWMRDNLNVGRIVYVINGKITDCSIEKLCYGYIEEYCSTYGGLYTNRVIDFYTPAERARSICPEGWHLPAESEWLALADYLGGQEVAGGAMKEPTAYFWKKSNTGSVVLSGFDALPGGYISYHYDDIVFNKMGKVCCFWSSTSSFSLLYFTPDFKTFCLLRNKTTLSGDRSFGKSGHSVRCIKDK